MTDKKSINLTVIYGPTTRKLALIIAGISGLFWLVSLWQPDFLVPTTLLLWIRIAALFTANFSETGRDYTQNMLRRYLSYKSAVCAFIGFIMAVAFIQIVFGLTIQLSTLYLAGGLNLAILLLEWGLRWSFNDIEIADESMHHLFTRHPGLIGLCVLLTAVTLIGIFYFAN